jgi:hypothetical protein
MECVPLHATQHDFIRMICSGQFALQIIPHAREQDIAVARLRDYLLDEGTVLWRKRWA